MNDDNINKLQKDNELVSDSQNQNMDIKQSLKKVLFSIARSTVAGNFIGFAFENLSNIIPLNKLVSNDKIVVFEHPSHFWEEHFLVVPKKSIRRFLDINFEESTQANAILDIFPTTQVLVRENHILEQNGNFALLVNGGAYQDVPQIHFHLAAGKAKCGIGFIPNNYKPQEGKIILQNNNCTIAQNANPEREIDYIVVPNVPVINSFSGVDFSDNSSVILKTLATVQNFLQQLELPAFTILTTESDIQNSGKFNIRIVSGKRIS
jgi:diadenosine tetraphosphate (Ap4A) HIT family hydrolase